MMVIRPELATDIGGIHMVNRACFPTDAEARLVDALRSNGHLRVSLVAMDDGAVVGHVAFSPVTTGNGAAGIGLAPVAVLPSHRRRGVAARLIKAGLAICRKQGHGWVVVLGEPRYYKRVGFVAAAKFGLTDEYGGGAAFQVLELRDGCLPTNAGLVRYAPEFHLVA